MERNNNFNIFCHFLKNCLRDLVDVKCLKYLKFWVTMWRWAHCKGFYKQTFVKETSKNIFLAFFKDWPCNFEHTAKSRLEQDIGSFLSRFSPSLWRERKHAHNWNESGIQRTRICCQQNSSKYLNCGHLLK